jgi:uncharacterized membrane protein (DUF485 family)
MPALSHRPSTVLFLFFFMLFVLLPPFEFALLAANLLVNPVDCSTQV